MPNRFTPLQSGTDPSQQLAVINKNFAELDNENVKKLFYDSSGTPSVYIGVDSRGQSVIKVAKSGIDVTTATNADLAFNSSQNTFKIVGKSAATIPAYLYGTGQINYTKMIIPHNLGFTPIVQAYVAGNMLDYANSSLFASGSIPLPIYVASGASGYYFNTASGAAIKLNIQFGIDSNNLYVQSISSVTSGTADTVLAVPLTYYLLQETAN